MKDIVKIDQAIGGDGGKIQAGLGVQGDQLAAQVVVTYPIAKIVEPATQALDAALDKLKAAIPGDWDDKLIENVKVSYKTELVKLLSE